MTDFYAIPALYEIIWMIIDGLALIPIIYLIREKLLDRKYGRCDQCGVRLVYVYENKDSDRVVGSSCPKCDTDE